MIIRAMLFGVMLASLSLMLLAIRVDRPGGGDNAIASVIIVAAGALAVASALLVIGTLIGT